MLIYLKLSKIGGSFWSPSTHPDNKGFRGFKKGRSSSVFLKVQFWFLIYILNWKDYQVDPIGIAPLFPSGYKKYTFGLNSKNTPQDFKNTSFSGGGAASPTSEWLSNFHRGKTKYSIFLRKKSNCPKTSEWVAFNFSPG